MLYVPQQPYFDQPIVSTEQYYRQLAAEHHRRAQWALHLAQEERQEALRLHQLRAIDRRREPALREVATYRQEHARREAASRLQQLNDGHPGSKYLAPPRLARSGSCGYQHQPDYQPRSRSWRPELARSLQESEDHGYEALLSQFLGAMAEDESKQRAAHSTRSPRAERKPPQFDGSQKQDQCKCKAPAAPEETPQAAHSNFLSSIMDVFGGDLQQPAILRRLGLLPTQPAPTAPTRETVAGLFGIRQQPVQVKPQPKPQPVTVPAQVASTPSTPSSIHSHSFSSLDNIESRFTALKAGFTFPSNLDFDASSQELQYTFRNAPVRQYEADLTKLLTELDAVDSDGTESIRGARKAIVKAVEVELDRVDRVKAEAWAKAKEGLKQSAVAVEDTPAIVPTSEVAAVSSQAVEEVAPFAATLDDADPLSTIAVSTSQFESPSEPLTTPSHHSKHLEDGAEFHQSDVGQSPDVVVSQDDALHFEDTLVPGPEVEYMHAIIVDDPVLPGVAQGVESVQQVLPVESETLVGVNTVDEITVRPQPSGDASLEDLKDAPAIEELAHSDEGASPYPNRSSPPIVAENSSVVLSDAEASSTDDEQQLSDEESSVEFVSDGESSSGGDGFEML